MIPDGTLPFIAHAGFSSMFSQSGGFAGAAGGKSSVSSVLWLQMFSGTYLTAGAGVAIFFLRWFWSSNFIPDEYYDEVEEEEMRVFNMQSPVPSRLFNMQSPMPSRAHDARVHYLDLAVHQPTPSRSAMSVQTIDARGGGNRCLQAFCQCVLGKTVRCVVAWLALCVAMHAIPPSLPYFKLRQVNTVLSETLPIVNSFLSHDVPATFGVCKGAANVPDSAGPLPCIKGPALYEGVAAGKRISALWVSGLNTTSLATVKIVRVPLRDGEEVIASSQAAVPDKSPDPASSFSIVDRIRYELEVEGSVDAVRLFLRVDECKHGDETCKPMMASSDACCGDDRHFSVRISASCRPGDSELSDVHVNELKVDPLVVHPTLQVGALQIQLPTKDIAPPVEAWFRAKLTEYLTNNKIIWWGTRYLDLAQLFNKVLRYNSPHEEFHC
eukprot:gnl/TRDRNA2_/TRDRNA2_129671_c1_seq1.p1 gnl/TRDRNA2_/TRDRNA2_129671_c1~~gnl/TRDRNA2_/TRDRNA2_129671_c1_seq1.p1  ORF type:complete len:474 (-),score=75.99 gnl/TRDRNA2_/TRDRNA2_129671_c1_seq1:22-1338(-)